MLNKTYNQIISLVYCKKLVFLQMFKKIFLNQFAAILKLAAIATLKGKIRDGNLPGITEYIIDKGFPPRCPLLTKKVQRESYNRDVLLDYVWNLYQSPYPNSYFVDSYLPDRHTFIRYFTMKETVELNMKDNYEKKLMKLYFNIQPTLVVHIC